MLEELFTESMKGPFLSWSGKADAIDEDGLKCKVVLKEMSATELDIALRQAVGSIHSGAIFDLTISASDVVPGRGLEDLKKQMLEALGQGSIIASVKEQEEQKALEATV
ncbi:MAG: hypothetical protein M1368_12725 [Thaumarchaeota archaeon]|nr:hypothetical protein [Nitrososphaerota archaeon]